MSNTENLLQSIPVLQEEEIRFYIKDLENETCTIPVEFDSYNDLGHIIIGMMKLCKYAMLYKESHKIPDAELSMNSISDCLGIAIQLIPQVELEFLSEIMEQFKDVKSAADYGNATGI